MEGIKIYYFAAYYAVHYNLWFHVHQIRIYGIRCQYVTDERRTVRIDELVAMQVYERAFTSQQYGVGQAEALILFVIVAVITLLQVGLSKSKEVEA